MRGRRGPFLVAALAVGALLATAGCTAAPVDPQRSRTVVVTVDVPFESLNGATTAGRAPGSTLVRGLVQDRFTTLDGTGAAVPDTAVGTVAKVSDDPLTVRYTIAPNARWSDGVPVTGDDLLLEWAARSGQLDEAAPDGGTGSTQGEGSTTPSRTSSPTPSPSAAANAPASASASSGAAPSGPRSTAPARDTVWFGAVSPVLVHAPAVPTVDAHGLTLVYADPVADWPTALDLNLAAHVVGRLALGSGTALPPSSSAPFSTATPSDTSVPSPGTSASSGPVSDAAYWSALVTAAIEHSDHAALVPVSRVWRTAVDATSLQTDTAAAVSTGPYRLAVVDPGKRVELVRNDAYAGSRPAAYDRIVVRSDLDPLAQVAALRSGTADVVAPVDTADVRAALAKVPDVRTQVGGGAVLQLQLQEGGGSVFGAGHWAAGGDDGRARAAALRAAFVGAVDRARLAALADGSPSGTVLAIVGAQVRRPGAGGAATTSAPAPVPTSSPTGSPVTPDASSASATAAPSATASDVPVRVLVSTDDQVRRDMLTALTTQLAGAGFAVTQAQPADPSTALWADPASWDVALVPVPQSPTPVASLLARWRSNGATDVTGHRDPALDALLDAAARATDPQALPVVLDQAAGALTDADVVVPLVRQPVLAATVGPGRSTDAPAARPRLPQVPAVPWGAADLTSWWRWASTAV